MPLSGRRRYLIVPGITSSRIHVLDTKPNPRKPKIVKVGALVVTGLVVIIR
jgi:hypothetical protein